MKELVKVNGDLTSEEMQKVQEISQKNLEKMQKKIHEITGMNIKVKTSHCEGSRKKFSVISSINLGSRKFEANSENWKFIKAVNDSLKGLANEVEHSFHLSNKSHVKKR